MMSVIDDDDYTACMTFSDDAAFHRINMSNYTIKTTRRLNITNTGACDIHNPCFIQPTFQNIINLGDVQNNLSKLWVSLIDEIKNK